MDFVAVDVETANARFSSICQIGLARYSDGVLAEEWKSYVDPQDEFDGLNVGIHGITASTVKGAPTFAQMAEVVFGFLAEKTVVSHMPFDRTAINQAAARCGLNPPACIWIDSARVARRAWKEFAYSGYGLNNVCNTIGYSYKVHDALEDAKAAANVLLAAIKLSGIDLNGWTTELQKRTRTDVAREGDPDGILFGEVMVFTGSLLMRRNEAADMAARIGCQVDKGVTKRTTILVVGDQDLDKLVGHDKSEKHRKAEQLIQKGQPIRIVQESDFNRLVTTF